MSAPLLSDDPAVLVRVIAVRGSAPRETDAWMVVSPDSVLGTIGGGRLEFDAIDLARKMLATGKTGQTRTIALGPEINQCCGGSVDLEFRGLDATARVDLMRTLEHRKNSEPVVFLYGAGHVGRALAKALAPLPFNTLLTDTRPETLGEFEGSAIKTTPVALPETLVRTAAANSAHVILTHDHALDYQIVSAALARDDLAYVGLIGSKTKRAVFRSDWIKDGGSADVFDTRLVCPIGANPTGDKRPEVIAAFVAAELCARLLTPAST